MANDKRTEKCFHDIKYKWNTTVDMNVNDFKPLVDKILNSNRSCVFFGTAEVSRFHLINMIKKLFIEKNKDEERKVGESEKVDSITVMKIKTTI